MAETVLQPFDCLEELLRGAGKILLTHYTAGVTVRNKGIRDPVTAADDHSEKWLVEQITSWFPDHSIQTEESRSVERGPCRWIIDPLDGTNNFARGIPHFAVSIAWHDGVKLACGGIFDPIRNELFLARQGRGATCNGNPLKVSQADCLISSLLATGFAYRRNEMADNNVALFSGLILDIQDIRRMGAAALDFTWLACGRIDGFWELDLKPWDIAAGMLIVEEAGGRVSNETGASYQLGQPLVVASNGRIHDALLERINLSYPVKEGGKTGI